MSRQDVLVEVLVEGAQEVVHVHYHKCQETSLLVREVVEALVKPMLGEAFFQESLVHLLVPHSQGVWQTKAVPENLVELGAEGARRNQKRVSFGGYM